MRCKAWHAPHVWLKARQAPFGTSLQLSFQTLSTFNEGASSTKSCLLRTLLLPPLKTTTGWHGCNRRVTNDQSDLLWAPLTPFEARSNSLGCLTITCALLTSPAAPTSNQGGPQGVLLLQAAATHHQNHQDLLPPVLTLQTLPVPMLMSLAAGGGTAHGSCGPLWLVR